jgi:hypothetical protein
MEGGRWVRGKKAKPQIGQMMGVRDQDVQNNTDTNRPMAQD